MKFLTFSVILSFVACIIFTVVCMFFTWRGVIVPDSLIESFYTVFGVEFAAAAAIKIAKHRIKSKETDDNVKRIKENGLEVSKSDLKASSDTDYYYNDYEGGDSVG